MPKGISSVTGNRLPKIGEINFYEVAGFYPGTVIPSDESAIKWKLFVEESTGNWRELVGEQEKTGKRVPFKFPQQWYGKKLLIEAYLHNSEKKSPPGIIVMPVGGERKIDKISFFDFNWNAIQQTPKYGQTLNVRIQTVNMLGETLRVSLWERDTYSDTGHDPEENTNLWGSERSFKVQSTDGKVEFPMMLNPSWAILAGRGIFEGNEHEYYLLVKGFGATTKFSTQRNISDEVVPIERPPNRQSTAPPRRTPTVPASPTAQPANPPTAQPITDQNQEPVKVDGTGANPPAPSSGVSPVTVNPVKIEGIIDAYFAKKEFTKLTGLPDGEHEYFFGGTKANNNTSTAENKAKVADAILSVGKVNDKLKTDKKYTTKEAIIASLVANEYGKDTEENKSVKFQTFKLGEEFKKIPSAPLGEKVYLVATSYLLEGKQATITVKEKDGVIKGSANAVLPLSEISEEKMASTEALSEDDRTEKTEFTGTIVKIEVRENVKGEPFYEERLIIPVQLQPKTDADLAEWKEKLAKGKKDEYIHKYTPTNSFTVDTEAELNSIADTIVKKSNESPELKDKGLIVFKEDIIKLLKPQHPESYGSARYSEVTPIPTYKKVEEELWLNVKATSEKEHNKDFLKSEGAYFKFSKKKSIIFPYLVKPENDINGLHKTYYWGANQGSNQATFNSNRKGGRKHAGRDLYSKPYNDVVAICDGKVLDVSTSFADGTGAITILHETNDGRKFIIRYGEVENNTVLVKKDDLVKQQDKIGKTGWLRTWYKGVVSGYEIYMLHFEYFSGEAGFDLTSALSNSTAPFRRRSDLQDGLAILQEGYRNTFEEGSDDRVPPSTLNFSQNGLDFLKGYEQEIKENGKHVYFDDDYDFCTIGYGHLIAGKNSCANIIIPENFKNGLTDDEANALLSVDVQRISNLVKSKVTVNLYQYEFDALVSLAFNVETSVGPNSTLLRKLNSQDYAGAADEFKNWRMAAGVVAPGLVKRRSQETEIFKNNVYDSTH